LVGATESAAVSDVPVGFIIDHFAFEQTADADVGEVAKFEGARAEARRKGLPVLVLNVLATALELFELALGKMEGDQGFIETIHFKNPIFPDARKLGYIKSPPRVRGVRPAADSTGNAELTATASLKFVRVE